MSSSPAFPNFQDRDLEIGLISAGSTADLRMLNFYGEAGIGKSRLLQEAKNRLQTLSRARVLELNLAAFHGPDSRQVAVLRQLAAQSDLPEVVFDDHDVAAGMVVDNLIAIGRQYKLTLLIDTTEVAQNDPGFWQWFEKFVLSPLISEGAILVVLAGRLPAPIRLVEVRRYLKVLPLNPLPLQDQARQLVTEVLAEEGANQAATGWDTDLENTLTDAVLGFSHGHPLLSIYIAAYLADPANREPPDSLRYRVATDIVGPFINDELFPFKQEMARWRPLMEWASVLDWFDATVLYRFDAAMSGKSQPETEWQNEFVKAMAQLRAPYAVVAWQEKGYSLVGTVKSIVASYIQAAQRDEYLRALQAAALIFESIAEEYFSDNPQAGEPYRQAAQGYGYRFEREVQDETTK